MWFANWYGNLVFGNESLFAFRVDVSRIMRPMSDMRPRMTKHIVNKKSGCRKRAAAAKDG